MDSIRFGDNYSTLEAQQRKNAMFIPTLDKEVKMQLRACGEPICLFGEGPAERRERLKKVLEVKDFTEEDLNIQRQLMNGGAEDEDTVQKATEVVYSKASPELIEARRFIVDYSVARCRKRLEIQREEESNFEKLAENEKSVKQLWDQYSSLFVDSSQSVNSRPLSCCRLNNQNETIPSNMLLTGYFGGDLRLWNVHSCEQIHSWKAHNDRICSVAWSPLSSLLVGENAEITGQNRTVMFASASADKTAMLWGYADDAPILLQKLTGHINRVSAIGFHPSGRFCGTASFDKSFRFWDIETGTQLLLQDGHAREIMGLDFQCDGSLAATSDQSGVCLIWDLRTGRNVSVLQVGGFDAFQGHTKAMVNCTFSPNGFQFATAGDDNTVKIWDLRKQKSIYTIPAHNNVVSDVRYDKTGEFLFTCSFDKTIKVWSTRNFKCLKVLEGHDSRIAGIDVLTNKRGIVSCSHDKTWKRWTYDGF